MGSKGRRQLGGHLAFHGRSFCESTSIHGFAYWVAAPRLLEKLFWVAVVAGFATGACLIIASAVEDWMRNPGVTQIETFSKASFSQRAPRDSYVFEYGFSPFPGSRSLLSPSAPMSMSTPEST